MWIYLIRHGFAEAPSPGQKDEERALTQEGRSQLHLAGITWNKVVTTPDVVFTSPYLRARETATTFAEAVGFYGQLRPEAALVPHATPEQAIAMLEGELLAQTAGVAVIGHEPLLGCLLGSLLTGNPQLSIPFQQGMLAALQTESNTTLIAGLRFSLNQSAACKLT